MAMPSSSSSKGMATTTGPKISSRADRMSLEPGDEGGLDVVAALEVLGPAAADHDLALGAARLDVVEDPLLLGAGDDRADHGRGLGGVAHGEPAGEGGQALDHLVEDAPVDDGPGGGGADLAGVEGPGRADGGDGRLQVGVVEHHRRALAAELHEQALHGRARRPRRCAGRPAVDPVKDTMSTSGEEVRTDGRLRALRADQVDHAGREPDLVEDPGQLDDGQRVLGGRLDDHGVAHGQGRGDLAGHVGQGEVVAGDGGHHADRLAVGEGADEAAGGQRGGGGGDRAGASSPGRGGCPGCSGRTGRR